MNRMFPNRPISAASAVVINAADNVLLIQRDSPPFEGYWSVPGGAIELGETPEEALKREVAEECNIEIQIKRLNTVQSRIVRNDQDKITFHYVIVNYIASFAGGSLCAGSDARDARWVPVGQLSQFLLSDGVEDVIHQAMSAGR